VQGFLVNPNPKPMWAGLVGSELDVDTGNYLTSDFGWNAGIDSFLEVGTPNTPSKSETLANAEISIL
jgi:hypothetical protein